MPCVARDVEMWRAMGAAHTVRSSSGSGPVAGAAAAPHRGNKVDTAERARRRDVPPVASISAGAWERDDRNAQRVIR